MPVSGRELILAIGADLQPGASIKELLHHAQKKTGIGFSSLEKAWKGQYESKPTISKLQRAADNANNLASKLEKLAEDAQRAGRPRRDIDALRAVADQLRSSDLSMRPADNHRSKK